MWSAFALLLPLAGIRGTVRDAQTLQPLAHATVRVAGSSRAGVTDSAGRFSIDVEPPALLRIARLGYVAREFSATDSTVDVLLTPAARALEGVTVSALRGEDAVRGGAPITQRVVRQDEIEQRYSGQEMPFLLGTTPSITTYSDGGAYSNYSYFRIRGVDQTRVNITLDGVPLNDGEDQGVFFSNFPDFANSVQSVQVQRGVGTSTLGVASYAGSVNFESPGLGSGVRRGEVQLTRGAFNTTRGSAEWQSGLLPSRLAFYGRASAQQTDGFRDHAGNRSQGGWLSAGYFGDRTSAKLTALSGVSRNEMAYLASPAGVVADDPRDNPLSPLDRDRFRQSVASLALTRLVGSRATATATAYSVRAGGEYDVTFDGATSNFNLRSEASGAFVTYNRQQGAMTLNLGVHANTYWRDHFAYARPDLKSPLYRNTGRKREGSAFAKAAWERGRVRLFGDLQVRRAGYEYEPDAASGVKGSSVSWSFANPRVGITYAAGPATSAYVSWGATGREPARNDLFAGFDNVDTTNAAFVGPLTRVRPERVGNVEAGVTHRTGVLELSASLYSMDFRNEITPIGALSYIGLPLRKNVRSSYRRGVEFDAMYRGWSRAVAGATITWSRNRIGEFTDDASGRTFRDVDPLLTPRFIASHSTEFRLGRGTSAGIDGRYVSRSFLANDSNRQFVTPPGYLLDLALRQRVAGADLLLQVRNVLDRVFYPAGYTDGATSYYYVTPARNLALTARIGF